MSETCPIGSGEQQTVSKRWFWEMYKARLSESRRESRRYVSQPRQMSRHRPLAPTPPAPRLCSGDDVRESTVQRLRRAAEVFLEDN